MSEEKIEEKIKEERSDAAQEIGVLYNKMREVKAECSENVNNLYQDTCKNKLYNRMLELQEEKDINKKLMSKISECLSKIVSSLVKFEDTENNIIIDSEIIITEEKVSKYPERPRQVPSFEIILGCIEELKKTVEQRIEDEQNDLIQILTKIEEYKECEDQNSQPHYYSNITRIEHELYNWIYQVDFEIGLSRIDFKKTIPKSTVPLITEENEIDISKIKKTRKYEEDINEVIDQHKEGIMRRRKLLKNIINELKVFDDLIVLDGLTS